MTISELRHGNRPSLAKGFDSPDLSPELEKRFRSGTLLVTEMSTLLHRNIYLMGPGLTDNSCEGWQSLGFPDNGIYAKETATALYKTWSKSEIGFSFPGLFVTDDASAKQFRLDFPEIEISGRAAVKAERLLHFAELLRHAPHFARGRKFIGTVDSYLESGVAASPGRYSFIQATGERQFTHFSNSHFDRHFSTAYLLMEIGFALFYALNDDQIRQFREKTEMFHPNETWEALDIFSGGFHPSFRSQDQLFASAFMYFRLLDNHQFIGERTSPGFTSRTNILRFFLSLYRI